MILNAELEHYSENDFCNLVENRYGWSVGGQARAIFAGEPLEEQNRNALACIVDLARSKKELELVEELTEYIEQGEKNGY